jgi:hypothetical protein
VSQARIEDLIAENLHDNLRVSYGFRKKERDGSEEP